MWVAPHSFSKVGESRSASNGMNLNKAFILGRVTADPQLRTTPSGQQVTSFAIATNRTWTDKAGARQEQAEFHNVVVWGRQAEVATQFLVKGSLVLVEGRLQSRTWQNKEGQNVKTTEIITERLQLGPRPMGVSGARGAYVGDKSQVQNETQSAPELPTIDIDEGMPVKDEDLPF